MIIKEVDSITTTDKFSKAGFKAEEEMAHYLSRAFKDTKDILVLNGIRLESGNDSVQIDHLIIHKYGMIIVESKSVVGTIEINDHGEWQRLEYKRGMPSPIEQAKSQAIFLQKYLNESALKPPHDAFKSLVHKITFDDVHVDVLVAISDTGIIVRQTFQIDEVHKADMIVGKIKEIIASYRKQDSIWSADLFKLEPTPLKISPELMNYIAQFLKEKHVPKEKHARLQVRQDKVTFTVPAPVNRELICQKCGNSQSVDFELVPYSTTGGRGYVVQRTKDKQRLSYWSLPVSQGLYAFDVAGTSYRKEALQDSAFNPGKRLAILPEPDNPVDPQALAVWDSAHKLHIGYVPNDCPPKMKKRMIEEEGSTYISMWENREGKERVGLRVLVIMPNAKIKLPNK